MNHSTTDPTLFAFQITAAIMAGLFLVLAQTMGAVAKTKYGKSLCMIIWFYGMWRAIDNSPWRDLPQRLVHGVPRAKTSMAEWLTMVVRYVKIGRILAGTWILVPLVLTVSGSWYL